MPQALQRGQQLRLHCGADPTVLFQGLQGALSGLTHLPILHKEDMQWVQSAEVEDVDVVLNSHLRTRPSDWSLMLNTTSEAPEGPVPHASL